MVNYMPYLDFSCARDWGSDCCCYSKQARVAARANACNQPKETPRGHYLYRAQAVQRWGWEGVPLNNVSGFGRGHVENIYPPPPPLFLGILTL